MLDVAASRGIRLELRHLQNRLGIAVVPIQANRGLGLEELKAALIEAVGRGPRADASLFPAVFEKEVRGLQVHLATQGCHAALGAGSRDGEPGRRAERGARSRSRNCPGSPLLLPAPASASPAASGAGAAIAPGCQRVLSEYPTAQCRRTVPRSVAGGPGSGRSGGLSDSGRGNHGPLRLGPLDAPGRGVRTEELSAHGHRPHRSGAHASFLGAGRLCGRDAHGFPVGLRLGPAADGRDRRRASIG